ncbi:hypothetical protein K493DRAFT_357335 [Basidiobolus meristosporus CBS 931.73]|uniref:Uncharacterized protein n=1 Tax=Basidiobolus meristosporus CBS 931.73 TaxID=1314790 RepID=A0A1Y1XXH3_9FUNG|nr:hypothetical protein K493DRAFT_357335 [Basidiobolus meristosporus CBS 931.73]|eukprot:ORX90044.1 hypothetical protein K493DRAFT_357335 [Basidiobolus meristosporus CBS 931.73]
MQEALSQSGSDKDLTINAVRPEQAESHNSQEELSTRKLLLSHKFEVQPVELHSSEHLVRFVVYKYEITALQPHRNTEEMSEQVVQDTDEILEDEDEEMFFIDIDELQKQGINAGDIQKLKTSGLFHSDDNSEEPL